MDMLQILKVTSFSHNIKCPRIFMIYFTNKFPKFKYFGNFQEKINFVITFFSKYFELYFLISLTEILKS